MCCPTVINFSPTSFGRNRGPGTSSSRRALLVLTHRTGKVSRQRLPDDVTCLDMAIRRQYLNAGINLG
jgi:hypothetical protein